MYPILQALDEEYLGGAQLFGSASGPGVAVTFTPTHTRELLFSLNLFSFVAVDCQFGGVDQRKIFIFARENLPLLGYKKRHASVPTGTRFNSRLAYQAFALSIEFI